MRASKTAVIMWKFQSHFATNWKQIRIPPLGNVVKLEAGANEERGERVVKSWHIYNAQGYKRVLGGKRARPRLRAPTTPLGARSPARGRERATPPGAPGLHLPQLGNNKLTGPSEETSGPDKINLQTDKLELAKVRGRRRFLYFKKGWLVGGEKRKQIVEDNTAME